MYEDIYPKLVEIIADVLAIDESEVALKKRLVADLGAESIDFLDLIFQMEKAFSVKIPRGQLEQLARSGLSDEEFEQDGVVTERGVAALQKHLSEVPAEYFVDNMKVAEIPKLFTVETLCKLVQNAKANVSVETA